MKRFFTLLFLIPLLASGAAFMPWLSSAKGPSGGGGGAATWQTLTNENMDGVTAPAIPTSLTSTGASVATSTTNPQSGANTLISTTTSGVEDYAYFNATDGHSGEARTTADVRFESGGSAYGEARVMVRASAKSASPSCYFVNVYDEGAGTVRVRAYKRSGGTSTALSDPFTLASGIYYRVTIQAEGTTISARCQRLSDDQYLTAAAAFEPTAQDFYSTTDSTVTGTGYQGAQIYRESGAALFSVDNLHAEAKF
jgi:hypothetical protein